MRSGRPGIAPRVVSGGAWLVVGALVVTLGALLPVYWVYLLGTVAISALIARSIGVVTGQAGIITLCQMSFAGMGGWVVSWAALEWPRLPFPLLVLLGGLAAAPVGLLLGAATARIRGVELAVVTLGFAAALDLMLRQGAFPGVGSGTPVIPTAPFDDPRWFFALAWGALLLLQLGVFAIGRTAHGLGWSAVRGSERGAASLGVNVVPTKASAFGAGALLAGVAGGLLAGQYGLLTADVFSPLTSMVHLVTAVLCGAALFSGALLAGVFAVFVPEGLRRIGLPIDVGNALLALGAFDVLRRGTGGIAEQLRSQWQDRAFRDVRTVCETHVPAASDAVTVERAPRSRKSTRGGGPDVHVHPQRARSTEQREGSAGEGRARRAPRLEISALTVAYGGNRALDGVDLSVREGDVHALIGPNGAGKSTLVDAATGFLAEYSGSVILDGSRIDALAAHLRARRGLRRTFQQSRGVATVTVGDYLHLAAPAATAEARGTARRHFGLPEDRVPLRLLDIGTRRILEIAGALAARPRVLLLDEPAAGLVEEERAALVARIRAVPVEFGCAVLLIEHDMEFVRAVSTTVTVLEEGRIIASGPVADTLESPRVIAAYLGKETAR
ncbi:MAG: ATP-binding cassette domain-containing protein [Leucobacter sp.]